MEQNKKNHNLLIAMGVSLVICFLSYVMLKVHYETNDDTFLNLIAVGAFGEDTQHMVYFNILYGYVLKGLYALVPSFNWYLAFFLLEDAISIACISYIITDDRTPAWVILITLLCNFALLKDFYVELNFTKTAGILIIAGGLLLVKYIAQKNRLAYLGATLMLVGMAIRYQCAIFLAPFFAVYIVYRFVIKHDIKKDIRSLLPLGTLIVGILLFMVSDAVAYHTQDWKEAKALVHNVSQVIDYGMVHYDAKADEFAAIGMSKEASEMINHYMIADQDVVTSKLMEDAYDIEKQISGNGLSVSEAAFTKFGGRLADAFSNHMLPFAAVVLVVIALFGTTGAESVVILSSVVLLLGEYYYLSCQGRVLWRVEVCLWLILAIMSAICIRGHIELAETRTKAVCVSLASLIMILCMLSYMDGEWLSKDRYATWNQPSAYEFIQSTKGAEQYYVGLELDPVPSAYKITKTNYQNYFSNYGYIGSWWCVMPNVKSGFVEKDMPNPIRALVEKDNVFFVGTDEEANRVCQYLEKTMDKRYELLQEGNAGDKEIWKITEKL